MGRRFDERPYGLAIGKLYNRQEIRQPVSGVGENRWYICCCATPSLSEFEQVLDNLVSDARRQCLKVIADDFTAWALE